MTRAQSLWTVLIALLACPSVGRAQPFPTSFDRDPLLAWIAAETQVRPQDVVSVGATDIIAMQSLTPAGPDAPQSFQVSIHAEVVSARVAEVEGYRSWSGLMRVDCARQSIQALAIKNYAERNLQGASRDAQADDAWLTPRMGSQLYSVVSSACDPGFHRPFGDVAVAQTGAPDEVSAVAAVSPAPLAPPVASLVPASGAAPVGIAGLNPVIVQLSASPTETLAQEVIERVTARFANGRSLMPRVERVVRSGKTLYRARLGGFDSVQDAQAFCRTLQASAQDCFVSSGPS